MRMSKCIMDLFQIFMVVANISNKWLEWAENSQATIINRLCPFLFWRHSTTRSFVENVISSIRMCLPCLRWTHIRHNVNPWLCVIFAFSTLFIIRKYSLIFLNMWKQIRDAISCVRSERAGEKNDRQRKSSVVYEYISVGIPLRPSTHQ